MKLKKRNGETMIEALVACLIIALAITMLANVMTSSTRVMKKNDKIQENTGALMDQFWNGNGTSTETNRQLNFGAFTIDTTLIGTTVTIDSGASTTIYEFKQ